MRSFLGIVVGIVAWIVVASLGDLALRLTWQDYAAVERSLVFTLPMQAARLALGAISTVAAGFVVAWITRRSDRAVWGVAAVLLVYFIPVHFFLWDRFPVWYHLIFLSSLVAMPWIGAMLSPRGARSSPAPD